MTIKILKAGADKCCVEFQRTSGDQLDFFNVYKQIKDDLDLEDATY